jgi:predicted 2-oxoglutarate/Fe(II)-dependent dioxygenase YbiX
VGLVFLAPHAGPRDLARIIDPLKTAIGGDAAIIVVLRAQPIAEVPNADRIFLDPDGVAAAMYGASSETSTIYLLDANLRILDAADDARALEAAVERSRALFVPVSPVEIRAQAPVLLVPNALDEDTCRALIVTFEKSGGTETGVEYSVGGAREEILDPNAKKRRDLTITDDALLKELTARVGRTIIPEVQKAFAFKATCFEGFKIARYDAAVGGHFRAHRDNLSPSTAHRRFALSLNLNDGYEGGQLRFPEYGGHLYRPSAGGAIVFSCSHLHEATVVTRGSRYVLLSFLFDEPGSRRSARSE